MTLARLIILVVSLLLLPITAGALAIVIQHNREQWQDQLASHAQDTATALGLALAPYLTGDDRAGAESLVDAIFDRGYYRAIVIRAADGTLVLERQSNPRPDDVPPWLTAVLPLPAPTLDAPIMNGWKEAALVSVTSHPGYAYRALWMDLWSLGRWFALGWLVSILLIATGLRWILSPLRTLENQALRVAHLDFMVQKRLPGIRELRRATQALNLLSEKFRALFSEYSASAENLRELAYRDPLTGLPNARHLCGAIEHLWEDEETRSLMLIQIDDFQALNARLGRQQADQHLRAMADSLAQVSAEYSETLLARVEGATFALLGADMEMDEMTHLAEHINTALSECVLEQNQTTRPSASFGLYAIPNGLPATEALAQADTALRQAQAAGGGQMRSQTSLEPLSGRPESAREQWLRGHLAARTFQLRWQPVLDVRHHITLHAEAFARLPDTQGHLLLANAFLPLAERCGLHDKLDLQILKLVQAEQEHGKHPTLPHAINLSARSLADEVFLNELLQSLTQMDRAERLLVETTEAGYLANATVLKRSFQRLRERGVRVGLDHFGQRFIGFDYLLDWRPDYLKLDGAIAHRILEDANSHYYLKSLSDLAHGLNLTLIATQVENEPQKALLTELGVDGVQGRWVDGLVAEGKYE